MKTAPNGLSQILIRHSRFDQVKETILKSVEGAPHDLNWREALSGYCGVRRCGSCGRSRPPVRASVDPNLVPACKNPGNRPVTAAVKPLHDGRWWAQATKGFNFKQPDMINADLCNRILWKGIMGDDKPYPGAGVRRRNSEPAATDRD